MESPETGMDIPEQKSPEPEQKNEIEVSQEIQKARDLSEQEFQKEADLKNKKSDLV